MERKMRVGLIGARADHGWAGVAHVPAIAAVPSLELHAVATTREHTAMQAAATFGAKHAFGNPFDLIHHPNVDIVSVVVKAPQHAALVRAAVAAGKPVVCEWPLGISLQEASDLAEESKRAGVPTAICLQGRLSPWIRHVRALVQDGSLGRILSTTFAATDQFSTGTVSQANTYMLDARSGANPLTIHAGHFLDTVCFVLGEFVSLSAQTATTRPEVTVRESGERIAATAPDQVAVAARLADGGLASVHIRPGHIPLDSLRWEIQGSDRTLRVTSETGYVHWRPLKIEVSEPGSDNFRQLDTPEEFFDQGILPADGVHRNVAALYGAFVNDLRNGTRHAPDFGVALARHRMIDAIEKASAKSGMTRA